MTYPGNCSKPGGAHFRITLMLQMVSVPDMEHFDKFPLPHTCWLVEMNSLCGSRKEDPLS